jgi:RNA polymerase sigma factor (sigma-70 family)
MKAQASPVLRYIRKIAAASAADEMTDSHLLERFVCQQDEAAFTALVERYGPLVLSVCRRVLHHEQDAEDAFQATFLVLVRRAGAIRKRESIGSWLYGVAYRVARKAKACAARRTPRQVELQDVPAPEPTPEWLWRDLRPVLDEEVSQLPERYRAAFVLCYLRGQTNEQAAQHLGCPLGTVLSRLSRAREMLRTRLARRGLALTSGMLAIILSERAASAAVPMTLMHTSLKVALPSAAGKLLAGAGAISPQATALAEGVMKAMFLTKLKITTAVLLLLGLAGTGAGVWTYRSLAANPANENTPNPVAQGKEELKTVVKVPSLRDGVVLVIGTEVKEGEKVPADRLVSVKVGDTVKKYRRLKKGDVIEEGQLLAQLDDDMARAEVSIKEAKLAAAQADDNAAVRLRDEAKARWDTQIRLRIPKGGGIITTSAEDLRAAQATYERSYYDTVSKREAVKVADAELKQARKTLEMYQIRSRTRGVLQSILKHRGEAVKALESVFLIQVSEGEE